MNLDSTHTLKTLAVLIVFSFFAFGCSGGSSGGGGGTVDDSGDSETQSSISITSPSNSQTITKGESINFQGSLTNGSGEYDFEWNFDNAARNYKSTGTAPPGQDITFNATGTYTVSLSATDNTGVAKSDSVTITVMDYIDTEPTAKILSPSGDPVIIQLGQSLDFQLEVQGGNAPFTFSLDFPDVVARDYYVENATTPPSPNVTFNTAGDFSITFTVTDADGQDHSDSVTVSVQ
jgi:hypothetical protein